VTVSSDTDNQTTHWHSSRAATSMSASSQLPLIGAADVRPIADGLVYWDAWPLLTDGGALYTADAGERWWFALAAPRFDDPDDRHAHARIHCLLERDGNFQPLGPTLPDGLSPGSREWSGSASIDPQTNEITLYFTAAGRRGETTVTFEQRLFATTGKFDGNSMREWSEATEIFVADEHLYQRVDQPTGEIGKIKAFRDPDVFLDPASDERVLIFTASSARTPGDFDGVIGAAVVDDDGVFVATAPLIDATGMNNELERPHIRVFDGRYYLFWSTQRHVFAPAAGEWPTGLYGAVADAITGPWRLLNGSGLVAATPAASPSQSYSWLVLPDRSVTSFVDRWGDSADSNFGGTFAPFVHLAIDGDSVLVRP